MLVSPLLVIPAEAGIQEKQAGHPKDWMPASAGMTIKSEVRGNDKRELSQERLDLVGGAHQICQGGGAHLAHHLGAMNFHCYFT